MACSLSGSIRINPVFSAEISLLGYAFAAVSAGEQFGYAFNVVAPSSKESKCDCASGDTTVSVLHVLFRSGKFDVTC